MPDIINNKLISWASLIDDGTIRQAERLARLDVVSGHVALMPDAHFSIDATVGSVIPTRSTILPAAIGTDIGCFSGDTKVPLLDGTQATLKSLASREEPFWIYALNENQEIVAALATSSKTRSTAQLMRVTVSGGDEIICTPDHQFMLRDGTYREAKDLRFNDSLMPLYRRWETRDGYESSSIGAKSGATPTHIRVWEQLHGPVPPRHSVHHANHNHFDNRPENLVLMTKSEHSEHHSSRNPNFNNNQDPESVARRLAGIQRSKLNPETTARRVVNGTANIIKYMRERPEEFNEATRGNGRRGAPYLSRFNTTPRDCSECAEPCANPSALVWHKRREHGAPPRKHPRPRRKKSVATSNHKVIAIEELSRRSDVYCLTVPKYGNFALAAGVFVHNCGMIAAELDVTASQLPDDLSPLLSTIDRIIPGGPRRGSNEHVSARATSWMASHRPHSELTAKQASTALGQFGTLGGGNHFIEICLDERDHVWVTLHSGSRGIGSQLAMAHIATAKTLAKDLNLRLEDPSLAYFTEDTPEFQAYITDMLWAQDYALANREQMMDRVMRETLTFIGTGREVSRLNSHHNFAAQEVFNGVPMWITRKGAVRAQKGDLGLIPGSMGAKSYVIEGLGNELSWNSCAHGAGRLMSRSQAKQEFTVVDIQEQMAGKTWLSSRASSQIDEIPGAYKPIDQVMNDQTDLVAVRHVLRQVLNFKGC